MLTDQQTADKQQNGTGKEKFGEVAFKKGHDVFPRKSHVSARCLQGACVLQ